MEFSLHKYIYIYIFIDIFEYIQYTSYGDQLHDDHHHLR